jgi:DGQHR domain-containing protein
VKAKAVTETTLCQFKAVEGSQHERKMLVGLMRAQDLARLYEKKVLDIDIYGPDNTEGYQRTLSKTRSRRFGRFIQDPQNGISPTTVLIYARDTKANIRQLAPNVYGIEASSAKKSLLFVADGQHRTDGFAEAVKEGWLMPDANYEVPITILFWDPKRGPSDARLEEATQFYTINQTQKRMRTDLAHRYIFKVHEREHGPLSDSTALSRMKKREYIPYAIYITDRLRSDEDSPWKGAISYPNASGGAPTSEQSFKDSMTPVIDYAIQANLKVGETITLLKSYWGAIFALCPKARSSPEKHVLMKTAGVYSLHIVLPTLLVRGANLSRIPTKTEFKGVLEKLENFFTDAFWDSDTGEAATYGTGRKAFQELADEVIGSI